MLQKILASKAGLPSVKPGDIVVVPVDTAVVIDLFFSNRRMPSEPLRIADPDRASGLRRLRARGKG